jgi:hypothetical protein
MQDNHVGLTFFTRKELKREEFAKQFLKQFFTVDSYFTPEYISVGHKWQKIGFEDVEGITRNWSKQTNISLERRTGYTSAIAVSMGKAANGYNLVNFWLNRDFFLNIENTPVFLDFSFGLYGLINPVYGYIHLTKDAINMSTINDAKYGKTIVPINLNKGLRSIYWGNFFGPDYVSLIGETRLLQTNTFQIVKLSDGGLFLSTTDSPLNIDYEIQIEIMKKIGQEFFYEWGTNKSNKVLGNDEMTSV